MTTRTTTPTWHDRRVIVAGGTAGFGLVLARHLDAAGGRVLTVCATGATLEAARNAAYAGVRAIDWPEGFCRHDIGWRAL